MKSITWVGMAAMLATLTGCGGGGGGSVASSANLEFPVESVIQRVLATSSSYSATDASTGNRLSFTVQPNGTVSLTADPAPSEKVTISVLVSKNGAVLGSASTPIWYRSPSLSIVGFDTSIISSGNRSVLPTKAKADSSGLFFTAPKTATNRNDQLSGTWSIEGQDGKAFICLTIQTGPGLTTLISFATTTVNTYCFLSDTAGNISGFRADAATNSRATLANPVIDRATYR